jgi:hypothetical protein
LDCHRVTSSSCRMMCSTVTANATEPPRYYALRPDTQNPHVPSMALTRVSRRSACREAYYDSSISAACLFLRTRQATGRSVSPPSTLSATHVLHNRQPDQRDGVLLSESRDKHAAAHWLHSGIAPYGQSSPPTHVTIRVSLFPGAARDHHKYTFTYRTFLGRASTWESGVACRKDSIISQESVRSQAAQQIKFDHAHTGNFILSRLRACRA